MTAQWSPLDRAIYGADDEDLNMILDYLDRAVGATEADDDEEQGGRPERRRKDDNPAGG